MLPARCSIAESKSQILYKIGEWVDTICLLRARCCGLRPLFSMLTLTRLRIVSPILAENANVLFFTRISPFHLAPVFRPALPEFRKLHHLLAVVAGFLSRHTPKNQLWKSMA